ncbi:hypothetical protein ACFQE1_15665 [Halobium palmae]|uniref:Uncharacterized protein n=1 Tax=Halobium palmae TaxID=1776492 RepID=A0ABD5S3C2_9EURY
MSSDASRSGTRLAVGPVRLVWTSLGAQLVGLCLLFVACAVLAWAADLSTPLVPTVAYSAVGGFVLLEALYLGGFRFR